MLDGEHNFVNFYSHGSNVKSTIRTITKCELKQINPQELFSKHELFNLPQNITFCYEITFIANGFLKQMIRHIVSKLWLVGSGKLSVEEFQKLLSTSNELKSNEKGKVAPSNGLYLFKIDYL
jgi:tRNA pseudouridine38-40 synthase